MVTSQDIRDAFARFDIALSYVSIVGLDVVITGKMNLPDLSRALLAKGWYWSGVTFHDDDETFTVEFSLDNLVSDLTDDQLRSIHRQIAADQERIDRGRP